MKTQQQNNLKTILLDEPEDQRVLNAAIYTAKNKIARIALLTDLKKTKFTTQKQIHELIKKNLIEIYDTKNLLKSINENIEKREQTTKQQVKNNKEYKRIGFTEKIKNLESDKELFEFFSEQILEIRKQKTTSKNIKSKQTTKQNPRLKKTWTKEQCLEKLKDSMYLSTMLLYNQIVDGIVSGAIHPTERTLKPAFELIGTKDFSIASSYFIMEKEDQKKLFFADCAVNVDPNEEQLAEIAVSTALSVKAYGIEPRIAMLSFSTKGSSNHEKAIKVRNATERAKKLYATLIEKRRETLNKTKRNKKNNQLIIDGEIQVDAAIVPEVAKIKCPDSILKGQANVFIFPNLESGNIGYKIAQRFGNLKAIGPIIQGLRKPINDLSRGCNTEEIIKVIQITSIQANQEN